MPGDDPGLVTACSVPAALEPPRPPQREAGGRDGTRSLAAAQLIVAAVDGLLGDALLDLEVLAALPARVLVDWHA